jgi:hypothetical protein
VTVDPAGAARQLGRRRLLAALRRLHRREPLKADHRLDAVIAEARADPGERRPGGHRGAGSLRGVSDAALRAEIDGLVTRGSVARDGRRVRLVTHEPMLADDAMRERVERLLGGLRELGADPPRVDAVASRLGIPSGVLDQLRAVGELVAIGEGIDLTPDVLASLMARIDEMARHGPLTIARVRDELRTSRRHAEALLAWRRSRPARAARSPRSDRRRDRRGVG